MNGKLVSTLIRPESAAYTIYRKKKWNKANLHCRKNSYHLLVFDNIKDAKEFAWEWCNEQTLEIWKVACRGSFDEIAAPCDAAVLNRYGTFYPTIDGEWTHGTKMYRKIKLIKRVYTIKPWRFENEQRRRNNKNTKRVQIVVTGRFKKAIEAKRNKKTS